MPLQHAFLAAPVSAGILADAGNTGMTTRRELTLQCILRAPVLPLVPRFTVRIPRAEEGGAIAAKLPAERCERLAALADTQRERRRAVYAVVAAQVGQQGRFVDRAHARDSGWMVVCGSAVMPTSAF